MSQYLKFPRLLVLGFLSLISAVQNSQADENLPNCQSLLIATSDGEYLCLDEFQSFLEQQCEPSVYDQQASMATSESG